MDEQRVANWHKRIRLNSDVGKRQHGPCRTVFTVASPDVVVSLADKVLQLQLMEYNRQACKAIDGDFQRGGFPPHARHAR